MADGFLGRWSRRKLDVQQGKPVEAEPPPPPPASVAAPVPAAAAAPAEAGAPPAEPAPPPPTLADVDSLTPASDFTRFVAPDVTPEVKNAAMKKLFADPHFNVMDGLDVYIEDYGKPDPLPAAMLRSLASADFLGLFDHEKREDPVASGAGPQPGAAAAPQSTPASPPATSDSRPDTAAATDSPAADADPDLRLQPDHAPGPEGPGHGPR